MFIIVNQMKIICCLKTAAFFMQYQGLFIGLTTIDIQYYVESFPGSNRKVKTATPDILVGGPATNAAVAFAHLNGRAFLASAAGRNSFSTFINNDFAETKTEHFDLVGSQNINPVIASVITSKENGDRNIFTHYPNFIYPDISPEELFKQVEPQIILLDGFYPEFSLECARIAKNKGIPVVLDCGSWKPQYTELLDFADFAICSDDFHPPDCVNSFQVIDFLKSKKVGKIAISRGGKSTLFFDGSNSAKIVIKEIKVTDTLGAGDFLHGAFCFYYLQLNDFKTALIKASELASFSCQFEGTRKWLNFTK